MQHQTYRVADRALTVAVGDPRSAEILDALLARLYVSVSDDGPIHGDGAPALVVKSSVDRHHAPASFVKFEVAGGGSCYTDEQGSCCIELSGSLVSMHQNRQTEITIWQPSAADPALTQLLAYGLAAALRRQQLFDLHSSALVDPDSGRGVLIAGPSGSGKSTLTIHLAAAGWSFLTDDVVMIGVREGAVTAWPLRRRFAVAAPGGKREFLPHEICAGTFRARMQPDALFFSELTGAADSRIVRLSTAESMTRLIRISPWSCYDRATAAEHLAALAQLANQSTGYALLAGRDLLDRDTAVELIGDHVRGTVECR